jgi:YHS domain-containing protein
MKFLFVEVIIPLLILLFLRSILSNLFASFRSKPASPDRFRQPPPTVSVGGELKKDPVCGTYVSTVGSVTRKVDGQLVYFCSTECRDKYRAA